MARKVVVIHEALRGAGVPHAFGGGLALASYAKPRPTADIDLNVFLPPEHWGDLRAPLRPLGVDPGEQPPRADELKLPWDGIELHLFFSSDRLHEAMAAAIREVPMGGSVLPIVAPEHLLVRKAMLDREKDWVDIEAILAGGEPLDLDAAASWLAELAGEDDERLARLRKLAASLGSRRAADPG